MELSLSGELTIAKPAVFSDVIKSGGSKSYMYIDVVYEGNLSDKRVKGLGLVVCGNEVVKIREFLGLHSEGQLLLTGQICTRYTGYGKKERIRPGIEVGTMGVTHLSGGKMLMVDVEFVMFRS